MKEAILGGLIALIEHVYNLSKINVGIIIGSAILLNIILYQKDQLTKLKQSEVKK